jgi:hypothetical protein
MKTTPPKTYTARKEAAFTAGLAAFREGKPLSACPIAKHQGLKRSWTEGWQSGSAEREKQSSGMFIAKLPSPQGNPVVAAPPPSPVERAVAGRR